MLPNVCCMFIEFPNSWKPTCVHTGEYKGSLKQILFFSYFHKIYLNKYLFFPYFHLVSMLLLTSI